MDTARKAVELARTLRGTAGIRVRQPLARLWIALPGGDLRERDALLALVRDEVNVRAVELIGDESDLVDRRVKPLLPKIGKRLGAAIPAVMAAAREGDVEFLPDGSVALAGVTLAPDEVEILATPRPGTAVAGDEGLVVVIDTELTPELLAEGDARELQRAIQDLRKDAGLELDDRIDLWVDGIEASLAAVPRRRSPRRSSPTRSRVAVAGREPDHDARPAELTGRSGARIVDPPPGGRMSRPTDLAAVPRAGGDRRRPRPAHEGLARLVPRPVRVGLRRRRLRPARPRAEQRSAVRAVPGERAAVRRRVVRRHRPDRRRTTPAVGPVRLPLGHARAAAGRRDRQPDRPAAARLRRRLRRHRDRVAAVLHVQRRRHGDQPVAAAR